MSDITYIKLFYKKGDVEFPLGLGHFDSEWKTFSMQLLAPHDHWHLELKEALERCRQIHEWMHTQTVPYVLDFLPPWEIRFWIEIKKLLQKTNINLNFAGL